MADDDARETILHAFRTVPPGDERAQLLSPARWWMFGHRYRPVRHRRKPGAHRRHWWQR